MGATTRQRFVAGTAELLAGIQGGVTIVLSTGQTGHLKAAIDQAIGQLRRDQLAA